MNENPLKIFVTGIGGDIGMGILKCLKDINYHSILIGSDTNEHPAEKYNVDYFYIAPRASQRDEYIKFILDTCLKHGVNYLIPSSEKEIKVINDAKDKFSEYNINVLINNSKIIEVFMDKYKTIEFFKENKVIFPKTYLLSNFNNELNFPFILKLKESAGSKGIFIINDQTDLNYYKKKYQDAIVQEIIGDIDDEYTIGIYSNGTKTYNIAFQRYLGFGSLSREVKLVQDIKIDELANKISRITNLKGSINVQVRKDSEGNYVPFEINPRLSSTIYFRHYFGFEDLKWWLDLFLGNEIEYTPRFKGGIGVRTLGEVFFELKESEEV